MKGKLFKVNILVLLSGLMLLLPSIVSAQDLPCGGDDPYGNCPLDSWIYLLAPVAIIATTWYLYKQQATNRSVKQQ